MIKSKLTPIVFLLAIILFLPVWVQADDDDDDDDDDIATTCPVGQVVVGVDADGNIICAVGAVGPPGADGTDGINAISKGPFSGSRATAAVGTIYEVRVSDTLTAGTNTVTTEASCEDRHDIAISGKYFIDGTLGWIPFNCGIVNNHRNDFLSKQSCIILGSTTAAGGESFNSEVHCIKVHDDPVD